MVNDLYSRWGKRVADLFVSIVGLAFLWPLFVVVAILIYLDTPGPVIFKQKRAGKNGKPFWIFKFRTMKLGADKQKKKFQHLNEAHAPLFKIKEDPRLTKIGNSLSKTGLDELPQLFNVVKGEMSLVGPRPLPIMQEKLIKKTFRSLRSSVYPGATSPWVVEGAHSLQHRDWIKKDSEYIRNIKVKTDIEILTRTLKMMVWQVLRLALKSFRD